MASNTVLKPLAPKVRKVKEVSEVVSSTTGNTKAGKRKAIAYHPTLGYAVPPPVPAKVARRNARERNRVKQVSTSFKTRCTLCATLKIMTHISSFTY